jgi:hypothetical protein
VKVEHGDIIYTAARTAPLSQLGVQHFGIWDARRRCVIHNALPCVQVTTWELFANGPVYIARRAKPGWAEFVVSRARAMIGREYNLLTNNCEHFVSLAAEGVAQSPQLQRAMGIALVGLIGWRAISNAPKYDSSVGRYRGKDGRFRSS